MHVRDLVPEGADLDDGLGVDLFKPGGEIREIAAHLGFGAMELTRPCRGLAFSEHRLSLATPPSSIQTKLSQRRNPFRRETDTSIGQDRRDRASV